MSEELTLCSAMHIVHLARSGPFSVFKDMLHFGSSMARGMYYVVLEWVIKEIQSFEAFF